MQDIAYVSKSMIDMWANFARTGDPTPPGSDLVQWDNVTPDSHRYLVIDTEMKMDLSEDYINRMNIWETVYEYPEGNTLPPEDDLNLEVVDGEMTAWKRFV